jgi:hypothetical protein
MVSGPFLSFGKKKFAGCSLPGDWRVFVYKNYARCPSEPYNPAN